MNILLFTINCTKCFSFDNESYNDDKYIDFKSDSYICNDTCTLLIKGKYL